MKEFSKEEERVVRVKAFDPALEDKSFVIAMDADGMSVRRLGGSGKPMFVSWRSLVGIFLIHRGEQTGE